MAKTHSQAELTDSSLTLTSASSKHKRLVPLKYSCEEVWERMGNGLCIFCEEKDSPEHQLKHKRLCIVAKECDDQPLDESMPQFQVPVSASKILKNVELEEENSVLKNLEYVMLNEKLEQEADQMNVNEKLKDDGDVERGQKVMSNTKICPAHQLFDQMPSKEKHMKHLKAWKFKFKPTSKRSRLMDDKFSFVDATILLNKDPQETIWDCVKKEFKETMAGCGKTRVDRFKLNHATPRPGVYDKPLQSSVWDRGGSLLECVDGESFGVDKIKEWLFKVEEFFSIYFTPRELKVKLALNHFDGDAVNWHQSQLQEAKEVEDEIEPVRDKEMLVMPLIAINANLGFSEYNIKDESMKVMIPGNHMRMLRQLHKSRVQCKMKMQKMDLFSFGTHTEMEGNVELKQLLAAMERFSQEVIEQNTEGGLSCGDVKFHLKHKWRFRLFQSFSRLVLLAVINPWLSKTHAFSGQLQDLRRGEAESFLLLNFAAEPPFLWMENKSEPDLTASALERRKKKLCSKTWMFKYKVPHLDEKIFETSDQCIRKRGLVSADQETEDNQLILRSFMWVIQNCLDQYMVLLIASDAYDAQFSVGVGMNKKQLRLSLRNNRVWDPGGSLVDTATPCLLSLHFTAHHFIAAILSFLKNLEVKVSLKEEDVIQDKRKRRGHVWHVRKKQIVGHVGEDDWPEKKK